MTLLHSSEHNVSVRIERDQYGKLEISIKGPTKANVFPTVTYNDMGLRPITEHRYASAAGSVAYGASGGRAGGSGAGGVGGNGGAGGGGAVGSCGASGGCPICGSSEPHGHGSAGGGQSPDAGRSMRKVVLHRTHAELLDIDET